jgi:hypothetical protein
VNSITATAAKSAASADLRAQSPAYGHHLKHSCRDVPALGHAPLARASSRRTPSSFKTNS